MMKYFLLTMSFCLLSIVGTSQIVELEWAKSISGNENGIGHFVTTDAIGNVYVVGHFSGIMDFDPSLSVYNLTSQGQTNGFIQKMDVNGDFVWAKKISGISFNYCNSIMIDLNGDLIIGGSFSGPTDFDPGSSVNTLNSNSNAYDLFTLKLSAQGDFVWVKSTGGIYSDSNQEITLDGNGNIYTIGTYSGTSDFDPGISAANLSTTNIGDVDVFLQKLDNDGNFVWVKSLGQMHNGIGYSVATGPSNEVVVTGQFNGTADFDPGPGVLNQTSNGGYDVFVQKFFPNGDLQWVRTFGETGDDIGLSVRIDVTGKIYLAGTYTGSIDFNPTGVPVLASSNGSSDIFIEQLEANGDINWVRTIGGIGSDQLMSISLDNKGFIYATGSYVGTVDFDPSSSVFEITTQGFSDVYTEKLSGNGDFIWAKSSGGPLSDLSTCVHAENNGTIHVTGAFQGVADFDPAPSFFDLTSNGGNDVFIQKLSENNSNVELGELTDEDILLWPNPSNGIVNLNFGDIENAVLSVYDIFGHLVYSESNLKKLVQVDLPLNNGVYIFEIHQANTIKRIKVLRVD